MELTEEMDLLLEEAEKAVQNSLKNENGFPVFALVLKDDGESVGLLADGFDELRAAIGGLLKQILPMVGQGDVAATLIGSSMPVDPDGGDGWRAAMFDIEDRRCLRAYVVLPYRQRATGGWQYGPMEFSEGRSQVFAGNE